MADFPQNPTKQPDPIPGYPLVSNGYAKPATPEDIAKDESGVTYPNLHRRIVDSLGLHTFTVSIFGQPILKDDLGNNVKIPDIATSTNIIDSLIANAYDVKIVDVGEYVKDYVIDWVTEDYQAKFVWVIRSEDDELECVLDYTLNDIADEVYRGVDRVLAGYPGDNKIVVTTQYDGLLSKDTYKLFTSTLSSFRTTEHHTHDENSNSEIP